MTASKGMGGGGLALQRRLNQGQRSETRSPDCFHCAPVNNYFLHHLRWGQRLAPRSLSASLSEDPLIPQLRESNVQIS